MSSTQTKCLHEKDRRAGDAQEYADRRETERPDFCELGDFLQNLTGSVDDFLDVFVIYGVDVHGADFVKGIAWVCVCQRTLDNSLHADGVGVNTDEMVFDEYYVKEGFVQYCGIRSCDDEIVGKLTFRLQVSLFPLSE